MLNVILRYGRKFENTVEVGSAELKRGKLLDRKFLVEMFIHNRYFNWLC